MTVTYPLWTVVTVIDIDGASTTVIDGYVPAEPVLRGSGASVVIDFTYVEGSSGTI